MNNQISQLQKDILNSPETTSITNSFYILQETVFYPTPSITQMIASLYPTLYLPFFLLTITCIKFNVRT